MHVVSRNTNQAITVCKNTVVTVIDIRGEQTRLGIEVPKDVSVQRRAKLARPHHAKTSQPLGSGGGNAVPQRAHNSRSCGTA